MNCFDRITINPAMVSGQPCIRGIQLTVKRVLKAVALYLNWAELQREYSELKVEGIRQSLKFATCNLNSSMVQIF